MLFLLHLSRFLDSWNISYDKYYNKSSLSSYNYD